MLALAEFRNIFFTYFTLWILPHIPQCKKRPSYSSIKIQLYCKTVLQLYCNTINMQALLSTVRCTWGTMVKSWVGKYISNQLDVFAYEQGNVLCWYGQRRQGKKRDRRTVEYSNYSTEFIGTWRTQWVWLSHALSTLLYITIRRKTPSSINPSSPHFSLFLPFTSNKLWVCVFCWRVSEWNK